jgi:hypothetical protein
MRHRCSAISCACLTGPFPAAPMSVQVGQRRDRSRSLSRHLGNVGWLLGDPSMAPFVLAMLVATAALDDTRAPVFAPVSPRSWFTMPGENVTLHLRLESGAAADPIAYRIVDYSGKLSAQGELRRIDPGQWEIALRPEQGFFEIELPKSGQRFGVVSLPQWKGDPDPFFAIDGALSWLERDASRREELILTARRCGIAMVRERLSWAVINSDQGRWDWEGRAGYEAIRRFYRSSGVPILEMAHDSPSWLGRVGIYPRDLVGAAASWGDVARRWHSAWGGLEVWNEPDIFFDGDVPADQYVAVAKTLSYSLSQAGIQTPLVGGVMALPNRDFRETCGRSGLLDRVDAFSFHSYDRATDIESLAMKTSKDPRGWSARDPSSGQLARWRLCLDDRPVHTRRRQVDARRCGGRLWPHPAGDTAGQRGWARARVFPRARNR